MEDFFINALMGGVGLALMTGPISCFILWRRMSYFGDALSHAALLGIAFGLFFQINLTVAALILSAIFSYIYIYFKRNHSSDSLLAIISQGFLAIALLMISFMPEVRVDLLSYLFGDILAINLNDLLIIVAMGGVVVVWLVFNWHKLLLITISEDLASIDQINVKVVNLQFMLIVSTLVAIAIKIVGVLLITAMLIIPAVVARGISKTPERMAMIASLVSVASVIMGLFSSLQFDTPSGPSIVASSILLFGVSHVLVKNLKKWLN